MRFSNVSDAKSPNTHVDRQNKYTMHNVQTDTHTHTHTHANTHGLLETAIVQRPASDIFYAKRAK